MSEMKTEGDHLMKPSESFTLDQWLYYLEHRHPQVIQLRLINAAEVAKVMNLLKWSIPVITVGGTNGKGSTVAALSAIYQAAGYRVGQFTSPHLFRFNERICINQQPIADAALCQLFSLVEHARADIPLTYFEMSLLVALLYFKEASLDLIILEVGVGGRLDATNIIDSNLAIVTTVDLDHLDWLGNDKEAIGREKAGIYRKNCVGLFADYSPPASLLSHAQRLQTEMLGLGSNYDFKIIDDQFILMPPTQLHSAMESGFASKSLVLPLPGLHPKAAAAAVIASMCLQKKLPVLEENWVVAMKTMSIPARQQWVPGEISFVYDVAHNPQASSALADWIQHKVSETKKVPNRKIHAIFSALKDKDVCGIIRPLRSIINHWHLALLSSERAASKQQLQTAFADVIELRPQCYADPSQATQAAIAAANPGDWIVVFGSFLLVSAIMTNHIIREEHGFYEKNPR